MKRVCPEPVVGAMVPYPIYQWVGDGKNVGRGREREIEREIERERCNLV